MSEHYHYNQEIEIIEKTVHRDIFRLLKSLPFNFKTKLELNNKFNTMSFRDLALCKQKYGFPKNCYDAMELKLL